MTSLDELELLDRSIADFDARWERNFKAWLRRRDICERAVTYLGGRCKICGYDACIEAFDFHHVDPQEKDFTLSERMTSFEAIQPELDKCELLCSRCHREVHAGLHPSHIVMEDDDRAYDLDDLMVAMG